MKFFDMFDPLFLLPSCVLLFFIFLNENSFHFLVLMYAKMKEKEKISKRS